MCPTPDMRRHHGEDAEPDSSPSSSHSEGGETRAGERNGKGGQDFRPRQDAAAATPGLRLQRPHLHSRSKVSVTNVLPWDSSNDTNNLYSHIKTYRETHRHMNPRRHTHLYTHAHSYTHLHTLCVSVCKIQMLSQVVAHQGRGQEQRAPGRW